MAMRVIFKAQSGKAANEMLARYMSSAAGSKRIGFIGLGNMGGFMTKNLMKKVGLDDDTRTRNWLCNIVSVIRDQLNGE